MRQPAVDPSKIVNSSVEMWQVCPAGRGWASEEIWNNRETQKHGKIMQRKRKLKVKNNMGWLEIELILARVNAPAEQNCPFRNPIYSLLCFFCSPPLDLLHLLVLLQTGVSSFFFPRCQHPSALLSETRAIISSYYWSGWRTIYSVCDIQRDQGHSWRHSCVGSLIQ